MSCAKGLRFRRLKKTQAYLSGTSRLSESWDIASKAKPWPAGCRCPQSGRRGHRGPRTWCRSPLRIAHLRSECEGDANRTVLEVHPENPASLFDTAGNLEVKSTLAGPAVVDRYGVVSDARTRGNEELHSARAPARQEIIHRVPGDLGGLDGVPDGPVGLAESSLGGQWNLFAAGGFDPNILSPNLGRCRSR